MYKLYKFNKEKKTTNNITHLTFNPELPTGDAFYSSTVRELCVPFSDYTGGPTTLVLPQQNATR